MTNRIQGFKGSSEKIPVFTEKFNARTPDCRQSSARPVASPLGPCFARGPLLRPEASERAGKIAEVFNQENSSMLCIGVNPISLPLEGGGLGCGCFVNYFITLPLIPSRPEAGLRKGSLRQGRGDTSSRFIGDLSGVVHYVRY